MEELMGRKDRTEENKTKLKWIEEKKIDEKRKEKMRREGKRLKRYE